MSRDDFQALFELWPKLPRLIGLQDQGQDLHHCSRRH